MKHLTISWMLASAFALTAHQSTAGAQRVEFTSADDSIEVRIGGRHVTTYLHGGTVPKPILYPLKTLGGITVTRGFPLAPVEGETTDHPHQVGLFFTYDDVSGSGFWNNRQSPPQIKHIKTTGTETGEERGQVRTISHWIARDGQTVLLEEQRTMIFQPVENGYSIDIALAMTAKTHVKFGDTKEGMFAIRVADWLREGRGTGNYFSAEGVKGADEIWARRAKWVALEGEQDGKPVGIAILNHPSSVNYPTYWHARAYGLFSANPLGQEDFHKGRRVANPIPLDLTLDPGETAHFRFLVLVYDKERTPQQIETEFRKFAK